MIKLLLLGDTSTGKTSLLQRFVYNKFEEHYQATISCDFGTKIFKLETEEGSTQCQVQIWDIAGADRLGGISKTYCQNAYGAIIVFDITSKKTFENVLKWKNDLDNVASLGNGDPLPTLLLANKSDLLEKYPDFKKEEFMGENYIKEFASQNNFMGGYLTSAKNGENVESAIWEFINKIMLIEIPANSESKDSFNLRPSQYSKKKSKCCLK